MGGIRAPWPVELRLVAIAALAAAGTACDRRAVPGSPANIAGAWVDKVSIVVTQAEDPGSRFTGTASGRSLVGIPEYVCLACREGKPYTFRRR